jgi:hypothetical protein
LKKINFVASSNVVQEIVPMPKPAKFYLPNWYKESGSFFNSKSNSYTNDLFFEEPGIPNTTVKKCMPFLDTLVSGYIQETWCDIFIERKDDEIFFHYSTSVDEASPIISTRSKVGLAKIPVPIGFDKNAFFHWSRVWNPILPKGYSALITHPLNRDDLPFKCFSGIIDSDKYFLGGKVGFFIKEDFSGLIPKGTPMYQIIPIKRESWKSEKMQLKNKTLNEVNQQVFNVKSFFSGGYKKLYWNKKDFN